MAKLYFKYGAMACGKTTALLQVVYNYKKNGFNVLLVKPTIDRKGGNTVTSRLGVSREVDVLLDGNESLSDKVNLDDVDSIVVDEAQFMTPKQIDELWIISKVYNIPVIAYGLKSNFQGHLFEGSKALFEKADCFDELVTICSCGKKARFNARRLGDEYTLEGEEVAIDGIDAIYESLCPECYVNKVLKITDKNSFIKYKK
ncbi:MAG: thymidine kinase [Bacilli bacterium]|nr:thymidine kinase [Bacilli bacterium]